MTLTPVPTTDTDTAAEDEQSDRAETAHALPELVELDPRPRRLPHPPAHPGLPPGRHRATHHRHRRRTRQPLPGTHRDRRHGAVRPNGAHRRGHRAGRARVRRRRRADQRGRHSRLTGSHQAGGPRPVDRQRTVASVCLLSLDNACLDPIDYSGDEAERDPQAATDAGQECRSAVCGGRVDPAHRDPDRVGQVLPWQARRDRR